MTVASPASTITLFFSTNLTLGLFFGFTANAVFSVGSNAVGTQPAVANPVNYLLLRSPSLRQYKNREWVVEKDVFSDILYRVPITTNAGTYIQYDNSSEPVRLVNDTLQTMNFYLTSNLSYTPIILQFLSWSFYFTITEVLEPVYESLFSTAFVNAPFYNQPLETDASDAEKALLEKQRNEALMKLEVYKKKIMPKQDVVSVREGAGDTNIESQATKPKPRRTDSRPPEDTA
jgi:hypothetical protein